jgi:hypothetical protein
MKNTCKKLIVKTNELKITHDVIRNEALRIMAEKQLRNSKAATLVQSSWRLQGILDYACLDYGVI